MLTIAAAKVESMPIRAVSSAAVGNGMKVVVTALFGYCAYQSADCCSTGCFFLYLFLVLPLCICRFLDQGCLLFTLISCTID